MGQILDRIFRIAKSYSKPDDSYEFHHKFNHSDDDLKRIIDELNHQKPKNNNSSNNYQSKTEPLAPEIEKAFKTLDLPTNATINDIKSSYKKKMMSYHPDRNHSKSKDTQKSMEDKTSEINTAYSILKKLKNF